MLKNKSIVVMGGSSGMGLAIAAAAAKEGAIVTIVSRSIEKLNAAKAQMSGSVKTVALDLNDEIAIKTFFDSQGAIDHLVMTAGTPSFRGMEETTVAEAQHDFEQFFWRTYTVAKYGSVHIKPTGSMVLTSGSIAAKPMKGLALACATANAVEGFAKALALDLAPIRVNVLCPGLTKTPLLGENPEETYAGMINTLLIKRLGKPEEMAQTALYLMNNDYITGQVLRVEGGLILS